MKKYAILILIILSSCGKKIIPDEVLVYATNETELAIKFYNTNTEIVTNTFNGVGNYLFESHLSPNKPDNRDFRCQICRTVNTNNDTIFIYAGKERYFQIDSPNNCSTYDIITTTNLGCPTLKDVMVHLKNTNDSDYYELLPNEECVTIERD